MASQAWIIIPSISVGEAVSLNSVSAAVDPRLIDNAAANALGEGTLTGRFVLPARIINDPAYAKWTSWLSAGQFPVRVMDSDCLFSSPQDG